MGDLQSVEFVLLLLLPVCGLMLLAERWDVPYPILLVLGGTMLGFIPGLPRLPLDPQIVLLFILPPLLYVAASQTSLHELRRNVRPIGLLAVGLVFCTTGIVAVAAHAAVLALTWPGACALGAIVSPPDAVAAAAIFERLGVPRRITTILQGESLVNDASALVVYRFAVAAAATGTFSLPAAGVKFVRLVLGGVLFGWLIGRCAAWARRRVTETPVNITLSLLTPFAAYLPAEHLHASSVLSVVTAGLVIGWYAPAYVDSDARLPTNAIWRMTDYLLNGIVFILIGLQLPRILPDIAGYTYGDLFAWGAGLSVLVVVIRFCWVFPLAYLARMTALLGPRQETAGPWQHPVVVSWAGMRGVISLAIAFGLPEGFPARELIVFLTFCVIFATLVLQGLTLPGLIRRLGIEDDGLDEREEAMARLKTANAALAAVRRRGDAPDAPPARVLEIMRLIYTRQQTDARRRRAELEPGAAPEVAAADTGSDGVLALRREILKTERRVLVGLRRKGEMHDDVLHRLERELDLEEQRVRRGA